MRTPDYRIYPSALKAFQDFLDYELIAEESWNKLNGEYKRSPAEMELKLEIDLINTINRVDKGPMEAADKGTAFNEVIDCIIENRDSSRDDCRIFRVNWPNCKVPVYRAEINGFTFDFHRQTCEQIAEKFEGSMPQYLAKGYMQTHYGLVEFYGYIDEWIGNVMVDLKTTSKYTFGKYERGWQHHLYPWCMVESGLCTEIDSFVYYVVEWAKGTNPILVKNTYEEVYTYDHERSGRKLREMSEQFISWLESRREFIQDKRIFGGENPDGWRGRALTQEEIRRLDN